MRARARLASRTARAQARWKKWGQERRPEAANTAEGAECMLSKQMGHSAAPETDSERNSEQEREGVKKGGGANVFGFTHTQKESGLEPLCHS